MKIAYIGHSHHRLTESTQFLIRFLLSKSQLQIFWEEPKVFGISQKTINELTKGEFDSIIFFQVFPNIFQLHLIKHFNITLIPMFDSCVHQATWYWKIYSCCKIISFSNTLTKKMNHGNILNVKYFPEVKIKNNNLKKNLYAFFWQRTNFVSWESVKNSIDMGAFDKIYLHAVADPGQKPTLPSQEDQTNYNISISQWFKNKSEYEKILDKCDVYFAPRKYEGIGMSFLEAMAKGKCVIAPNFATMNEYITNNVNGILYDIKAEFIKIDIETVNRLGKQALTTIVEGRQKWLLQQEEIFNFLFLPVTLSEYSFVLNFTIELLASCRSGIITLLSKLRHFKSK